MKSSPIWMIVCMRMGTMFTTVWQEFDLTKSDMPSPQSAPPGVGSCIRLWQQLSAPEHRDLLFRRSVTAKNTQGNKFSWLIGLSMRLIPTCNLKIVHFRQFCREGGTVPNKSRVKFQKKGFPYNLPSSPINPPKSTLHSDVNKGIYCASKPASILLLFVNSGS